MGDEQNQGASGRAFVARATEPASAVSAVPASIPDAGTDSLQIRASGDPDKDADAAVRLGMLYREIQSQQYACSEIVCTFPLGGNCWCFNEALARHVEQAIDDADESCKHGYSDWRNCAACTIRAKIAAQAIEARRAETTKIGSVADESAVGNADAPKEPPHVG